MKGYDIWIFCENLDVYGKNSRRIQYNKYNTDRQQIVDADDYTNFGWRFPTYIFRKYPTNFCQILCMCLEYRVDGKSLINICPIIPISSLMTSRQHFA